jgi:TIR domain
MGKGSPTVFISYSHNDERWKTRLVAQLSVLTTIGALEVWDDRRIAGGADWFDEIQAALDRAQVAILLISAPFLSSEFVTTQEVPRLLKRRKEAGLVVIPVLVEPCVWRRVGWLTSMQIRPFDAKPLASFRRYRIDTELAAIAEEVATASSGTAERRPSPPPVPALQERSTKPTLAAAEAVPRVGHRKVRGQHRSPLAQSALGLPALIRSRPNVPGRRGNFELVFPMQGGGVAHMWRNNNANGLPWSEPVVFGSDVGVVEAVTLIQSDFGSGNLELVARIGSLLQFFWRDAGPDFEWTRSTTLRRV